MCSCLALLDKDKCAGYPLDAETLFVNCPFLLWPTTAQFIPGTADQPPTSRSPSERPRSFYGLFLRGHSPEHFAVHRSSDRRSRQVASFSEQDPTCVTSCIASSIRSMSSPSLTRW